MNAHPVDVRDAGLDLIRRANRWLVVGAVTCAGVFSLVAAHAFHGRTLNARGASGVGASSSSQQPQRSASDDGAGLQSPAQAPAPAPSAPSPVVSGGS